MKYIHVDRKDFTLELSATEFKESVFVIPLEIDTIFRDLSPIENAIYYGVLYPAKHAEDKLRYPHDEKKGIHRGYKLAEPQPWLIALGFIMWQGIVQGLSWDIVKLSVQQALHKLASFGLAPADRKTQKKLSKERQVGFSWIKYGFIPAIWAVSFLTSLNVTKNLCFHG